MSSWMPFAVLGAVVCAALAIAASRPRGAAGAGAVRTRLLLAVAAFLAVLVAGGVAAGAAPEALGLPLVLAPGLGVAVALLLFGAVPWRRRQGASVRTASLAPRPVWTGAQARAYRLPVVVAAALAAVLVATGASSAADDAGRSRALAVAAGDLLSTTSPYPGWFYAAPLLGMTALVGLAAVVAVRRTAALPALSLDAATDTAWRGEVATALSRVAAAGLLLYLAGVLLMTGGAFRTIALDMPGGAWGAGSAVVLAVALASAAGALVALLTAVGGAARAAGRAEVA